MDTIKVGPAFQFYAERFLSGTVYMTPEEVGMYIRLLCKQWTDGKIPKKRLGIFLGLPWESLGEELRSKFTEEGEFIYNDTLEAHRAERIAFLNKQRSNGKKGGRPKGSTKDSKTQKKAPGDRREENGEGESNKKGAKKPKIPPLAEFVQYAVSKRPKIYIPDVQLKYEAWVENGWKTGGKKPRAIKNWKTTLLNTLPHIKEIGNTTEQRISRQTIEGIAQNAADWDFDFTGVPG